MLCFRAWLKQKTYWKYEDQNTFYNVQYTIKTLIQLIIELIPRTVGNNWHIAKIHKQLHVAENILLYGTHENVHMGPQEYNHNENTKKRQLWEVF